MGSKLRILDLDIENRPLSYLGQGFTTSEITAIAYCWDGEPKSMECWLLSRTDQYTAIEMLERVYEKYCDADMVTGHYIKMHDLPHINGALLEYGMSPLPEKLVCDTKMDLIKKGDIFSASQENLCAMFGLKEPKIHMNAVLWREANRLTPAGLEATYKRAVGDVLQHMALRKELVKRDLLKAPKVWRP